MRVVIYVLGGEGGLSDGIVAGRGGKGREGATSGRGHGGPRGDDGREAEHECDFEGWGRRIEERKEEKKKDE